MSTPAVNKNCMLTCTPYRVILRTHVCASAFLCVRHISDVTPSSDYNDFKRVTMLVWLILCLMRSRKVLSLQQPAPRTGICIWLLIVYNETRYSSVNDVTVISYQSNYEKCKQFITVGCINKDKKQNLAVKMCGARGCRVHLHSFPFNNQTIDNWINSTLTGLLGTYCIRHIYELSMHLNGRYLRIYVKYSVVSYFPSDEIQLCLSGAGLLFTLDKHFSNLTAQLAGMIYPLRILIHFVIL